MHPQRKVSSNQGDIAGKLVQDFNYLYGLRGTWNTHWTEIAQRIWPMHAWLFQNFSQMGQQGDKRNMEIYDSTGVVALGRFGAILDSLLTPRNHYWHHIRPDDDILMKDKNTKMWFEQVNNILFKERYAPAANFSSQNQLVYKSLGAYGTGLLFIDDLRGANGLPSKGLRYKNIHLGEVYLGENHQGIVDRVCRYFMLTARQAVQKFGIKCPQTIIERAQQAPESPYYFLHWVLPRSDRDPFRKDFKGMEYASYYVSIECQEILDEGGYHKFPYSVPRYEQAPNEAYGRSPAMDVLPAIKTLNEQKRAMLKQGHRVVDPVLLAHDDGIIDSFDMEPGSMNAGGVSAEGRMLVQALPVGNVQAGKEMMEQERQLINDTFLVALFQILTETPEMTAQEVIERTKEKGILLAPTIGRQESEHLGPIIDREIDILSRQGRLPPMPAMLKSAHGEYKIIYDSPISRTQKAEWSSGALRTIESLMQVAQATQDPSVLDYINWDDAAPEMAEINGTPARWINTIEEIQKIRQMRAHQKAVEQTIQMAPSLASMQSSGGGAPQQPQPQAAPQPGGGMPPVGPGAGPQVMPQPGLPRASMPQPTPYTLPKISPRKR